MIPIKLIKGHTYYHDSIVCQGGYRHENLWFMIDTGNDDSSARKSIRDIEDIHVKYVFNTHSHADHCGGNAFIQKRFNAAIIAPELEASFIENPLLEPVYLYGAIPPEEMKNKFLYAKPSKVNHVISNDKDLTLTFKNSKEYSFKLINLKGHSPNMFGIITPDAIAFLGDALMGEKFLEKHALIFTFDVEAHLASLEHLKNISADGYVIAHGGYYETIDSLIEQNKISLNNASQSILDLCKNEPLTFDDLHHGLAVQFRLKEILSTNRLNRSVIKAHVQYLVDSKELAFEIDQGKLLIRKHI